jgi:hypothetical protein
MPAQDLIDNNAKNQSLLEDLRKLLFSINFLNVRELNLANFDKLKGETLEFISTSNYTKNLEILDFS